MIYTIEKETLTALGDAIREKSGKFEKEDLVPDAKTYSKNQIQLSSAGMQISYNKPFSSCKFKFSWEYQGPNTITIYIGDKLCELDENGETMGGASTPLDDGRHIINISINGASTTYPITNFSFECIAYDENGDLLTKPGLVPNTMTPMQMAEAIEGIEAKVPVEPIELTGDCQYACAGAIPSNYIELYGNTISTNDITKAENMFKDYKKKTIPFDLNFKPNYNCSCAYMFLDCINLETLPKMNNLKIERMSNLLSGCQRIREIPEDWIDTWDFSYLHSYKYSQMSNIFSRCFSLRKIPNNLMKELYADNKNSYTYQPYPYLFNYCYALDEIRDLPVSVATFTTNVFNYTFDACYMLKAFTFRINEDGTPIETQWKNQTIDMAKYCGYAPDKEKILNYNSGITEDKRVIYDADYQRLKDDPDYWSTTSAYSHYNHDSAVETINSLPDTSAYLASAGGTNTIKFEGANGANTDGGAIDTLTEEEIAVATAKGWTVSLV